MKQTILIDDLDKASIATTTIPFRLDGQDYEIDLTDDHALDFRAALKPFTAYARTNQTVKSKLSAAQTTRRQMSTDVDRHRRALDRYRSASIRRWAIRRGLMHRDQVRGRIPVAVIEAYNDYERKAIR